MLALLVAVRGPALTATAVFRSRAWPNIARHAWARTFIATPSIALASSSSKSAEPVTKKKAAVKKSKESEKTTVSLSASETANTPKERGHPPKEKPIIDFPLPPKRPLSAFPRFYIKYRKTHTFPGGPEGIRFANNEASIAWKALPPEEKQVFLDEGRAAMQEWQKRRQEFYANVTPAMIKALNKQRAALGKYGVASIATITNKITGKKAPAGPYVRFFKDFRKDMDLVGRGREGLRSAAVACGQRWHAMSEEEKAPYYESYRAERDLYDAGRAAETRS